MIMICLKILNTSSMYFEINILKISFVKIFGFYALIHKSLSLLICVLFKSNNFFYTFAITSISISASFGKFLTATQLLAGLCSLKYSP